MEKEFNLKERFIVLIVVGHISQKQNQKQRKNQQVEQQESLTG